MTNKHKLTRQTIVNALVKALKPLKYIHAFWEGGAAAFNRIDEWSDIDIYVVVDDEKVVDSFSAVEKILKSLSPIKQKYVVRQLPWPGVSQAFYKLENASDYLLVDLAILKLSSPEKFLEPEIHGNVVFYFNKSNKVTFSRLDRDALNEKMHERLSALQERFRMFNSFVQKEINRRNYIEAIDLFRVLTLSSLVEALRIKHSPCHYDFKMRYAKYELPSEVVERLERLSFVGDKKQLKENYDEATRWFDKVVSAIS